MFTTFGNAEGTTNNRDNTVEHVMSNVPRVKSTFD